MDKSETRCQTPHCLDAIAQYGENYHMVHDQKDGTNLCEKCGGIKRDGVWIHRCSKCGADEKPGMLGGLFVPHMCRPCTNSLYESEKKSGNVCGMCRSPRSFCCC